MTEESKLVGREKSDFGSMDSTEMRKANYRSRRAFMPTRRKKPTDWPKAIKNYAKSYIPPLIYWYVMEAPHQRGQTL